MAGMALEEGLIVSLKRLFCEFILEIPEKKYHVTGIDGQCWLLLDSADFFFSPSIYSFRLFQEIILCLALFFFFLFSFFVFDLWSYCYTKNMCVSNLLCFKTVIYHHSPFCLSVFQAEILCCEYLDALIHVLYVFSFPWQGKQGFPGTPGLPGLKVILFFMLSFGNYSWLNHHHYHYNNYCHHHCAVSCLLSVRQLCSYFLEKSYYFAYRDLITYTKQKKKH